jgi:hypothetical protein
VKDASVSAPKTVAAPLSATPFGLIAGTVSEPTLMIAAIESSGATINKPVIWIKRMLGIPPMYVSDKEVSFVSA